MSNTLPPPNPTHGIGAVLRLVGEIRRVAHDRSLDDADAMRRIRDAFADYDQQGSESL